MRSLYWYGAAGVAAAAGIMSVAMWMADGHPSTKLRSFLATSTCPSECSLATRLAHLEPTEVPHAPAPRYTPAVVASVSEPGELAPIEVIDLSGVFESVSSDQEPPLAPGYEHILEGVVAATFPPTDPSVPTHIPLIPADEHTAQKVDPTSAAVAIDATVPCCCHWMGACLSSIWDAIWTGAKSAARAHSEEAADNTGPTHDGTLQPSRVGTPCQEDPYRHLHYPGCPHSGCPHLGGCPATGRHPTPVVPATPTIKGRDPRDDGARHEEESEMTPMKSSRVQPQEVPMKKIDTAECRPSDLPWGSFKY